MRRDTPIWIRVLLVAWLAWLLDVASKTWALATLESREPVQVLGRFLELTVTRNSGAAFNLATGGALFLSTFAIIVIATIGFWARRLTSTPWGYVFGLVLGGTLGNLTDRIFRSRPEGGSKGGAFQGQVVDWISIRPWPVFNIADSAIVIAAVLATVLSFRNIAPISNKSSSGGSDENSGENRDEAGPDVP